MMSSNNIDPLLVRVRWSIGLSVLMMAVILKSTVSLTEPLPSGAYSVVGPHNSLLWGEPVDINKATADELVLLSGIGPSTVAHIQSERESFGDYQTISGLMRARGVGPSLVTDIASLIVVQNPTPRPPINLNTASRRVLQRLPGIGPTLADRIVTGRPYDTLSDIHNVKGIGPVTYTRLKCAGVTVNRVVALD